MSSAPTLPLEDPALRPPARTGGIANLRRPAPEQPPAADEAPPPRQESWPARRPAPTPAPPAEEEEVELKGQIKRVIYQKVDEKGSFIVLAVKEGSKEFRLTTKFAFTPTVGERILARGQWGEYKGQQDFKASSVVPEMPTDAVGIAGWIKTLPGIGKATVEKIAREHGARLKEVIGDAEALMKAAPGNRIKEAQARLIAETWNAGTELPQTIAYLKGLGFGEALMTKIIKQLGVNNCRAEITKNPWLLSVRVDGIGFQKADEVARRNGNDMRCDARIEYAMAFALREASQNGHCGLKPDEIVRATMRITSLEEPLVRPIFDKVVKRNSLVYDELTGLAYSKDIYQAERNLAAGLLALLDHRGCDDATAARLIAEAEGELGLKLDPSQHAAATLALTRCVCIITGGPGTGKSTTLRVVHHALAALKRDIVSCAPTGRAAKRISELTGKDASTLHRLLQMQGGDEGAFSFNEDNPFTEDWFVVDEFSMVDVKLAWAFIQAIKPGSGLTIVGDNDQLPSVGPGQVLRDLIDSGAIPVAQLTVVHRQTAGSGIVEAAHRINRGEHPNPPDEPKMQGFNIQRYEDADRVAERLTWLLTQFLPSREIDGQPIDVLKDVQVMSATRVGDLGVNEINRHIKAALNPACEDGRSVTFNPGSSWERTFTVGDRVMQVKNNYVKGVYNGEVGRVAWVGEREVKDGKVSPAFEVDYPGGKVLYVRNEHDEVEHAYGITVHKSQGCEFPVVIFICPGSHRFMLKRNLFYTAVTRAKRLCVVIGDDAGINHAVRTQDSSARNTGLALRLRQPPA